MNKVKSNQAHWEEIFQHKDTKTVSWYQQKPVLGISLIEKYLSSKSQYIIDVGGGDSRLPDGLLELGAKNITVLDISEAALNESKRRLGNKADMVRWEVSDVLDFNATQQYDIWYDRAVFHFVSDNENQKVYKARMMQSLAPSGIALIGSFAKNDGPMECSGIEIAQQDKTSIHNLFCPEFEILEDFYDSHETPSGSKQSFYWVVLKRK